MSIIFISAGWFRFRDMLPFISPLCRFYQNYFLGNFALSNTDRSICSATSKFLKLVPHPSVFSGAVQGPTSLRIHAGSQRVHRLNRLRETLHFLIMNKNAGEVIFALTWCSLSMCKIWLQHQIDIGPASNMKNIKYIMLY